MNIDELRAKIEEICVALKNPNLELITKNRLQNELEQVCIDYYKLRKFSA